ncbi:MEKHLA domain-containing protein [Planotetraspora thailandica]|uniref:MEKHLA domain-containing protein n=1 Tax=Planotetraspora thailandica TaxID=487172 RepID=UPI00194FA4F2|nr:MEKHLA domain-containing protein [Planotetraspora thailandica]
MLLAPMPTDDWFVELLHDSFQRVVGATFLPEGVDGPEASRWLYENAPFALLAHDTSPDPVFVYANRTAQRCFEYGWDEFIGMPSRLSAEAPDREERRKFMEGVLRRGFVDDYRGLRIAKSGRRFWIEDAVVWNLVDAEGTLQGQAALLRRWTDA